jgi:transposase-like protein
MDQPHKACPACQHPKRAEIDLALVRGVSVRKVAKDHGFPNHVTIWRHAQRHLPKSTPPAAVAAGGSGDDLLAEVDAIAAQQQRLLDKAEEDKDYRAAITAGRELLRCVELSAKLRGEISSGPTINIIATPGFQQIVALMLDYADPFRRVELAERLASLAPGLAPEPAGVIEHDPQQ